MPFGLSNARGVCSRRLYLAMAHLPADYWLSYPNDILVYPGYVGTFRTYRKVVQAYIKTGIKIQPKTKIFQPETKYLGHKVSQGGVQMLEKYVKDNQNLPRPTRGCFSITDIFDLLTFKRKMQKKTGLKKSRKLTNLKGNFIFW